jgi:hypothetical protein
VLSNLDCQSVADEREDRPPVVGGVGEREVREERESQERTRVLELVAHAEVGRHGHEREVRDDQETKREEGAKRARLITRQHVGWGAVGTGSRREPVSLAFERLVVSTQAFQHGFDFCGAGRGLVLGEQVMNGGHVGA